MHSVQYWLMDERAFTGDVDQASIYTICNSPEAAIMEANEDHAPCCIVDPQTAQVMWEWFVDGKWKLPLAAPPEEVGEG